MPIEVEMVSLIGILSGGTVKRFILGSGLIRTVLNIFGYIINGFVSDLDSFVFFMGVGLRISS